MSNDISAILFFEFFNLWSKFALHFAGPAVNLECKNSSWNLCFFFIILQGTFEYPKCWVLVSSILCCYFRVAVSPSLWNKSGITFSVLAILLRRYLKLLIHLKLLSFFSKCSSIGFHSMLKNDITSFIWICWCVWSRFRTFSSICALSRTYLYAPFYKTCFFQQCPFHFSFSYWKPNQFECRSLKWARLDSMFRVILELVGGVQ